MTTLFKTEKGKHIILGWYERFRAKLTVPTETRTVTTRFGDTHVLVGGPAAAPPVVLVQGALASSAHLLVELAALLEQFRVYAVDVVGQSVKSAEPRISVANNDHGLWLTDVLDQLGLARPHLVGVSWGGCASIRLGSSSQPHRAGWQPGRWCTSADSTPSALAARFVEHGAAVPWLSVRTLAGSRTSVRQPARTGQGTS
jgi:hypothetical protein